MNDPNGLVYAQDRYHLFFQANPDGIDHGNLSWGHATSSDLMRWEEHPVAIRNDEIGMIFSGSAVVDHRNSSGFGTLENPPMVAIYTNHTETNQSQHIAFSNDSGVTWSKYEGNPVLDWGLAEFRDPKVSWDSDRGHWLMSLARPHEHQISFYSSTDLKSWQHLSDFGPVGATDGVWECPDLFELTCEGITKWVLIVSLNPGGLQGGSGTQYFIGDFDGVTFTQTEYLNDTKWLDFGADYYAAVSFNDAPENRRIMIGWMSNWDYAKTLPTEPYRGQMSIAREISLENRGGVLALIQHPVREASHLLREIDPTKLPLQLNDQVIIGFDDEKSAIYIDRSMSKYVGGIHHAPISTPLHETKLSYIADTTSVELFINDGEATITDLFFA
jgi:fructan beta-fructosidase